MVSKDDAISRSTLVNDMKGVVFREKPFSDADVDRLYQSIKNLYSGMIYLVETAPTIDAVPVVRCVDCKYRCTLVCPMYHTETCLDDLDGFDDYDVDRTDDDGFCHLGERRDGEVE